MIGRKPADIKLEEEKLGVTLRQVKRRVGTVKVKVWRPSYMTDASKVKRIIVTSGGRIIHFTSSGVLE